MFVVDPTAPATMLFPLNGPEPSWALRGDASAAFRHGRTLPATMCFCTYTPMRRTLACCAEVSSTAVMQIQHPVQGRTFVS